MVNWIMDLFPETATELGFFRKRARWVGPWLTQLRNWSLRSPGMVVCPTDKMAEFIFTQGISKDHVSVLHHWSDGEEIYPSRPRITACGKRGDCRMCLSWVIQETSGGRMSRHYAGSGKTSGAPGRYSVPSHCGGHQHAAVKTAVRDLGLQNVIFKPLAAR